MTEPLKTQPSPTCESKVLTWLIEPTSTKSATELLTELEDSTPVIKTTVTTPPPPPPPSPKKRLVYARDVKTRADWIELAHSAYGPRFKALEEWFADPMNTWAIDAVTSDDYLADEDNEYSGIKFQSGSPYDVQEQLYDNYVDMCYHCFQPEDDWYSVHLADIKQHVSDWVRESISHPGVYNSGFYNLDHLERHYADQAPDGWVARGKLPSWW